MKNEAEFCNVVKKSMICSYKIPDPSGVYANTIKRSFDGIGMLLINNELKFVCWEAKFLKKPQAFNFNRIEKHQSFYLKEYSKSNVLCFVIVGIDYGRADKRVLIFKWDEDMDALFEKGFSIHLKKLNTLPFNKIEKGAFNFDNIIEYKDLVHQ